MRLVYIAALLGTVPLVPAMAAPIVSKADADARCEAGQGSDGPGSDWSGGLHEEAGGLTPVTIPGATRVTPKELNCLYGEYTRDHLRLITPIEDEELIPGTYRVEDGWEGGTFSDKTQRSVERRLAQITGGDKDMALFVYCHSVQCFMSYNLALRATHAGYKNVYWLRSGIFGWKRAGGLVADGDVDTLERRNKEAELAEAKEAAEAKAREEKWEADRPARERAEKAADRQRRIEHAASLPEAPYGRMYTVTKENSTADGEGNLRSFRHELVIRGQKGDRFKISVRSTDGKAAPNAGFDLVSVENGVKAQRLTDLHGMTIDDPQSILTFELQEDGAHVYVIDQAGFRMEKTPFHELEAFGGDKDKFIYKPAAADPRPYTVLVEKVN